MEDQNVRQPGARPRAWVASFVIVAVAAAALAGHFSGLSFTLEVGPGDPDAYKFLRIDSSNHRPVRYDPCTPIHYVVNRRLMPDGAHEDIHEAFDRVSEATGIDFVFDGFTTEPTSRDRPVYQPERYGERWAPILVGWAPEEFVRNRDHRLAIGGSVAETNPVGIEMWVSGRVVLNSDEEVRLGFESGHTWGEVLMHELGHVVGLDHVEDPAQIMYAHTTDEPAEWGSGDREGLRRLGREAGCTDPPDPLASNAPFMDPFRGDRFLLDVYELVPLRSDDCVTHAFRFRGIGALHAAHRSRCDSWDDPRLNLFYVSLGNATKSTLPFRLGNFILVTRDGKYHAASDLAPGADKPSAFVPLSGTLEPGEFVRGWIGFVVKDDFVARQLTYADDKDLLTIVFEGRETVIPRRNRSS